MKRISLAFLASVLPALSAAPQAATLGVSMALFDDNFLTAVRASMKQRAQELNVPIQFEDAQNDIGRQLNQIQNFIAQKVDAIIVNPVDTDDHQGLRSALSAMCGWIAAIRAVW